MFCLCAFLAAPPLAAQSSSGGSTVPSASGGSTAPSASGGSTAPSATTQSPDNVDNLFNQGAVIPKATVPAGTRTLEIQDSRLHFFSNLNLYADLAYGYKHFPPAGDLAENLGPEGGASFSAILGCEVRPADVMRLRLAMEYDFPPTSGSAPALGVSELFVDYSFLNTVFFRVGVFNYSWGNSQFYQLGDLPSRSLPGWTTNNTVLWQKTNLITNTTPADHPVSMKAYVPFGNNGLTFLARADLDNYAFPSTSSPDPRYMGYGLDYEFVTGSVEWGIGGFTQYLLHPRGLLTMKTSAFGFDISGEAIVAFPYHLVFPSGTIQSDIPTGGGIYVGGTMQRIYPSAVIGIGREWSNAGIKAYLEYAYNGERDGATHTSWLNDESGPGGHNTALTVRFQHLGDSNLGLNLLWQQNWSDGSALIGPFIQLNPAELTTIQIGMPIVFGADNSEVSSDRLLPGSERMELMILLKVSDSFRN